MTKVIPKYGGSELILVNDESVKGYYVGINPVKTLPYFKIDSPEGHAFVRLSEKNLEVFCTRSSDVLEMWWNSEGEDGPEWPAGIKVEKVPVSFSEAEKRYVINRIMVWEAKTKEQEGVVV